MSAEPHLTPDEMEWAVDRLFEIVKCYGTLGVEEAFAELQRRMADDPEGEYEVV